MQAIKKKLRSQRGASLTFALLIFLVCAVVGSVVLAAGTATSGRLAELAEYEQRYHAVNSAAELLAKEICSGTTTIESQKKTTMKIVQTYDIDGTLVNSAQDDNPEETYDNPVIKTTANGETAKLLKTLAKKLIGTDRSNAEIWNSLPTTLTPASYEITSDGGKNHLKVDVKADMSIIRMGASDEQYFGELILTFNSVNSSNQTYTVRLFLKTDPVSRKSYTLPEDMILIDTQELESGRADTIQVTKTESRNQIIRWNLLDMTVGG